MSEKNGWPRALLSEVCEINPRRPKLEIADSQLVTFVPMAAVAEDAAGIQAAESRAFHEVKKGYTYFADGDVIFAKITPCMQNGKHAIVGDTIGGFGFGSTEFHVIRPTASTTSEWIHYFLRQPHVLKRAADNFKGSAGQQRVPKEFLCELNIPVPPLDEQRAITRRLMDQMKQVAAARSAAQDRLSKIDALPAALLREVFGD